MTIEYIPLSDPEYQSSRYSNILQLEQSGKVALTPYSDNPKYGGYPSIGAGFKIDSNWNDILNTLGFDTRADAPAVEKAYIGRIKALIPPDSKFTGTQMTTLNSKLKAIMFERFSYYAAVYQDYTKRQTFAFADDAEVYATFQSIAETKETLLNSWLSSAGVAVPMSDERLALFSLTYNNIIGFKDAEQTIPKSPNLLTALKDGDRLRAWFEIRYKSNADQGGIQYKRRYGESDMFGLWDGTTPTQTELTAFENFINQDDPYGSSLSILQLIRNYEADYNPHDSTVLGLPISNRIDETINSSDVKSYFVTKYGLGKPIDGNVILGTELGNNIITLSRDLTKAEIKAGYLKNTSINDLIMGGKGKDNIAGGAGNDVIYGNEGNDTLIGGLGYDTLIGGENDDTYIIDAGDGTDTIEDKQGNNTVIFCGKPLNFFYAADMYFVNADGTLMAQWVGTDLEVTYVPYGNKVILNEDFQWGDFGINLMPAPANSTINNVIYLDVEDPDHVDHRDEFYGTSGSDKIIGGNGNDEVVTICESTGNDWLIGGSGNDMVQAFYNPDDCILEGNSGVDALLGSVSNDRIFCVDYGEMEDLIAAGETATSLAATGDLPDGGPGNDFIYGSNARDGIFGGRGDDLLVGGGGDDLIYGDCVAIGVGDSTSYWTWSYTVEAVYEQESGDTVFEVHYNNIPFVFVPTEYEAGDDVIYAGTGNDYVDGYGGDDEIYGGMGNDTIFGDAGNDFIEGGDGDDILTGDSVNLPIELQGSDYIDGGAGNDGIYGDGGNDELFGGEGNDTIYGHDGDDYIDGESGENELYGGAGNDVIFGDVDKDTLYGGAGDDYLDGLAGENSLYGGAGNDIVFGGDDADWLEGDGDDDYLDSGLGNDTLLGGDGNDVLFGGGDEDFLQGDAGEDYLDGELGDDTLLGCDGNDEISGSAGNDFLQGDAGNDFLYGDLDNDILLGGEGDDYLDGGAGVNKLYGDAGNDMLFGDDDATGANELYGGAGNDSLFGGNDADWLQGDADDDYLEGGAGNDILLGGDGNDVIFGGVGDDTLQGDAGDAYLDGGAGDDIIVGGSGNDTLIDAEGSDWLQGGIGNDTLIGSDGNDIYYFGSGDGADVIENYNSDYQTKASLVQFGEGITFANLEFSGAGNDLLINIKDTTDSLTIKNWYSGREYRPNSFVFSDLTYVTAAEIYSMMGSTMYGTSGNDYLMGGYGNDTISGGTGDDTLAGGFGDDTYLFNSGDGSKTIDDIATETEGNTLLFGEGITPADLTLTIGSLDIMVGYYGDVIHFNNFNPNDVYGIHAIDRYEFADGTVLTYSELLDSKYFWISGTAGDDQINGTNGRDYITGSGGSDTLDGGTGEDWLLGDRGNDTYIFGRGYGQDTVYDYDTTEGNLDTILLKSDITPADVYVTTTDTGFKLSVNDTDDTLEVYGFLAGTPFEIEQIQFADGTIWGVNEIYSRLLNPTDDDDYLVGTDLNDFIQGLDGNDTILGKVGNDTLDGGRGNDFLYGGDESHNSSGDDTYVFGRGYGQDIIFEYDDTEGNQDTILMNSDVSPGDVRLSVDGYGGLVLSVNDTDDTLLVNDFVYSYSSIVEQIQFHDGTVWNIKGLLAWLLDPAENYYYLGGTDQNDYIQGLASNDLVFGMAGNDTLDGGSGSDFLYGGDGSAAPSGDDTYVFGRGYGRDNIFDYDETEGNIDTISLGSDISPADVQLEINESGHLVLSINDTDDALTVLGFSYGTQFQVEQIEFTDGTTWGINEIYYQTQKPTEYDDYRTGTDQNDFIEGLGGNDTLIGNLGDDTLDGGTGNDYLYGGVGNDTYIFNLGDGGSVIDDTATETEGNRLLFGEDITPDDLHLYVNGHMGYGDIYNNEYEGHLYYQCDELDIFVGDNGDVIHLVNFDPNEINGSHAVDSYEFADGTVLSYGEFIALSDQTIDIIGTPDNDAIHGTIFNDNIMGLTGEDGIDAGDGDDYINGGSGNDKRNITIYWHGDTMSENDAIQQARSDFWLEAKDCSGPDDLYGGAGNDTLDSGSDSVSASYISNVPLTYLATKLIKEWEISINSNLMYGGHGDDTYIVDSVYDLIFEQPGEGEDTVFSSSSYELSPWVENLTLTGNNSINGKGNDLDNILTGNSGNNVLIGMDGNDTYNFGLGSGLDTIINCYPEYSCLSDYLTAIDKVAFGEGITVADLELIKQDNDLHINIKGTNDSLVVKDWFFAEAFQIDLFSFTDGAWLTAAQLEAMGYQVIDTTTQIYGTTNDDILNGTDGNNQIFGSSGNDTIYGNAGDDTIEGGTGNDTLIGGDGNDTYIFNIGSGKDLIRDYSFDYATTFDKLIFGEGITPSDLKIYQEGTNLRIELFSGEDSILIENWASFEGTYYEHMNWAYLPGEKFATPSQIDWFVFADGTEVPIYKLVTEKYILGTESSEKLNVWNLGDTQINGYGGDDTLRGGAGNDTLDGGIGNDYLRGEGGNDTYLFGIGSGVDTISDSDGTNIVEFGAGITVDDLELTYNGYDDHNLQINIKGTADSLTLIGWFDNQYDYKVDGFKFADSTVLTAADLEARGLTLYGSPGNDTILSNFVNDFIEGGAGDDSLNGSNGNDTLDGGLGNDTLNGGSTGNDTYVFGIGYGVDVIKNDSLFYVQTNTVQFSEDITVNDIEFIRVNHAYSMHNELRINIKGTSDSLIIDNWYLNDHGFAVDQFKFADGRVITSTELEELDYVVNMNINEYYGSVDNDQIYGSDGADLLFGDSGNDTLKGGAGDDFLFGGSGNDTYIFGIGSGVDVIDNHNYDSYGHWDTVEFDEGIMVDDLALLFDTIGGGRLKINIKDTSDSLIINGWCSGDAYKIDQFLFADGTVLTSAQLNEIGFTTVNDIGAYCGAVDNDQIIGSDGNDTLYGNEGDDTLNGGAGNDTLSGNEGNDIYKFDRGSAVDIICNYASDYAVTTDTVEFGAGITANDLELVGYGDSYFSSLKINIKDTSDTLIIEGWFYSDGSKTDQFRFADGTVLNSTQLELLMGCMVYGSMGGDRLIGSIGNDVVFGFASNDTLEGIAGDDYLDGGAGYDGLTGNIGNDTLDGGSGNDYLEGDLGNDTYVFGRGSGVDTVNNTANDNALTTDIVEFGAGITINDLELIRENGFNTVDWYDTWNTYNHQIPTCGALRINIKGTSDSLIIGGWFDNDASKIDQFQFADGTALNATELELLMGCMVYGHQRDDSSLAGSIGNDTMYGYANDDTYNFGIGSGIDRIYNLTDDYFWATDTVSFGAGITTADLKLVQYNDDLIVNAFVNPIADQMVQEDALFSFTIDKNFDSLIINDWFKGDAYKVDQFQFADGTLLTGEQLESLGIIQAEEYAGANVDLPLIYNATLPDGSALPSWVTFNAETLTFSGMPTNENVGTLSCIVTATDETGYIISRPFDITVENKNDAPTVDNPIADQTAVKGNLFTFAVPANTFNDVDEGDSLTYSAFMSDGSALPSWLNFDAENMTFSGTPTGDSIGTWNFKVTATDIAGEAVSSNFNVTVLSNNPPVVTNPLINQVAMEDELFNFVIPSNTFIDVDAGDSLTYSATLADGSDLPSWMNFDAETMTFTGVPDNGNIGTIPLKVTATDTSGASVSDNFDLTVLNVNDAPIVINPIEDHTVIEDTAFSFTVPSNTFNDIDSGDVLTYSSSLVDGFILPSWLNFDAATLTFSGVPTNDDVGNLSLKVTVTDTAGANVSSDFNIAVLNVNDAPIIVNPIANQQTLEDEVFSFTVPTNTFNDVDAGDSLSYSATLTDGSALPTWLTFNTETRTFSGTPTNENVGTMSLKVKATDTSGLSVSNNFDVTILNVNDAPVVTNLLSNQTTLEDALFTFTVPANTFNDVDLGDSLSYSATLSNGSALPSWLTFDTNTMTFSGTPNNDNVGTLSLKVTAIDTTGASVSSNFNLTVVNVDDAPVIVNPIVDQTINKCTPYSYTIPANTFSDIDVGDTLTYSATLVDGSALPPWLNFNPATQTFSGSPTSTGKISVKVTAMDTANVCISDTFSLDVRRIIYGTNYMDIIITCSDNDLIYSLNGIDTVYSGNGDDIIYGGNDTDYLFGEGNNDIIYGESGNDYIDGGCGNDTLNGGSSADIMIGGSGDDTYVVDNTGDAVVEYLFQGTDTVQSSVTYSLDNDVENLVLTGSNAVNGTGNNLNNSLIGNSAVNTLIGNYGNDTLDGGQGDDILSGGSGSDTYLFRRTDGKDTLNETAGVNGDTDTLKLTDGITTTEPVLVKQGNDLYVFIDANNYMKIASEFQATNYGIERLEVSDGHYITRADIQTIVDTMSYINNDSGMDVMQKYNAMMNDQQYQNLLATSWHQ